MEANDQAKHSEEIIQYKKRSAQYKADITINSLELSKGPPRGLERRNALHERNFLSSHGLHRSTFGDGELNCRVRHGIG